MPVAGSCARARLARAQPPVDHPRRGSRSANSPRRVRRPSRRVIIVGAGRGRTAFSITPQRVTRTGSYRFETCRSEDRQRRDPRRSSDCCGVDRGVAAGRCRAVARARLAARNCPTDVGHARARLTRGFPVGELAASSSPTGKPWVITGLGRTRPHCGLSGGLEPVVTGSRPAGCDPRRSSDCCGVDRGAAGRDVARGRDSPARNLPG